MGRSEFQPLTREGLARALGKPVPADRHHPSTTAGGVISNPDDLETAAIDKDRPLVLDRVVACFPFAQIKRTSRDYVWLCNAFCFAVHLIWLVLCLRSSAGKADKMKVRVYRIAGTWNSTGANGYNFELVDNNMPLRIDLICAAFFGLSMFAHGAITFLAPFNFTRYVFWRNLDRAFSWWRWLEYSVSASIMMLGISLLVGLREQNALASVFILCWGTMLTGYFTEVYSHPLADLNGWEHDDAALGRTRNSQRVLNYVRRMMLTVFGIFLYIAMWCIVLNAFLQGLDDLRRQDKELYDKMPGFVPWAVFGTFIIFSLFTLPLLRYQWLPPRHYWRTEIWYCLLSLTAKSFLGGLLYSFVLRAGSFEEALSPD